MDISRYVASPLPTIGGDRCGRFGNFIDGEWVDAASGSTFRTTNPANAGEVVGDFPDSAAGDVDRAVQAAHRAQHDWNRLGPIRRGEILYRAAELLHTRVDQLASAVAFEHGKLLEEARAEVLRGIDIIRFHAGQGRRLHGSTLPADADRSWAMTWQVPLGVVGLITPWNFPLAIPAWKIAPALVSGCTAVVKPSPIAPLASTLLVQAFEDAGVPAGVLNLVQGDREPGERLSEHPQVRGISFTGSLPVGTAIQQATAPRLARTQLELGGKNAVIVLADADLDAAAQAVVKGAFGQSGQRCSATSRVVVDATVRQDLVDKIVQHLQRVRLGAAHDPASTLGPVVNEARLSACLAAVEGAVQDGAVVRTGGARATGEGLDDGWFMQPTVLTDVAADSTLATEEVFGPVLAVIDAHGYDDAMRIANSVKYGMSGTIFTRSQSRIYDALSQFQAGMLHVNRPGVGAWPHMPHVGAKLSQYGAAECSEQTYEFYMEWRTACLTFPEADEDGR